MARLKHGDRQHLQHWSRGATGLRRKAINLSVVAIVQGADDGQSWQSQPMQWCAGRRVGRSRRYVYGRLLRVAVIGMVMGMHGHSRAWGNGAERRRLAEQHPCTQDFGRLNRLCVARLMQGRAHHLLLHMQGLPAQRCCCAVPWVCPEGNARGSYAVGRTHASHVRQEPHH